MPNLYAADETEKIVGLVRPLAKAAGKLETRDAILQHYVQLGECVVNPAEPACHGLGASSDCDEPCHGRRGSKRFDSLVGPHLTR